MTFWSHLTSFGIHYKWSNYDMVSRISSIADILCFCVSKVYVNSWQELWWIFKQMEPVFVWVCMHLERHVGGWWGMSGLVWYQTDKHILPVSSQIPIEAHKREKRAAQPESLKLHEMNNEYYTQNSRGSPLSELHVDGFQAQFWTPHSI